MSFPEALCVLYELSAPFAYIGFALQIDGRIRYFRTQTTCQDFKSYNPDATFDFGRATFGEQVTLYGSKIPTRLRRENGDVYDIEPSESSTTRSFFVPSVVLSVSDNPKYVDNPHPELALRECRLLTDASERDLCLWHQAGHQTDERICEEITEVSRARLEGAWRGKCRAWVKNIRSGRINQ